MERKKSYAFKETLNYREYLEIKHLHSKSIIIVGSLLVVMIFALMYMAIAKYSIINIIKVGLSFFGVLVLNFMLFSYSDKEKIYLKMNKYISSLSIFTLFVAMIIFFKSPSLIPFLFVAYCLTAIYQDFKVMLISDLYFIFSIVMLMLNFPNLFDFKNASLENGFGIAFFSLAFLMMLSASSYIMIKEKSFFYNQISLSKEREFRSIELLLKFTESPTKYLDDKNIFLDKTNELLDEFSKKIKVDNIFSEKISILKDLNSGKPKTAILKEHTDFNEADLLRLENLLINKNSKLFKIVTKINNTNYEEVKKREIFSATHLKSFNKQSDSIQIKILAFVIYYVSLKKGLTGLNPLSDKELYDVLVNTDYYYYIDSRVMKIYRENADVFNTIIEDAFSEAVKS